MIIQELGQSGTFLSPGLVFDSTYYESFKYEAIIDSNINTSLKIWFCTDSSDSYEIKLFTQHIKEIISTDDNTFYIKTKSRPPLENLKALNHRVPYDVFYSDEDNDLIKLLLPHFLVLKLQINDKVLDYFFSFINTHKIPLFQGWYLTEDWESMPDFSSILNHSSLNWQTKYSILVLLTNSLMKLEDLTEKNLEIFQSLPEYSLANLFFTSSPFDPNLFFPRSTSTRPEILNSLVKRVFITPTTFIFNPPKNEIGNRVIRKYSEISDFFLRVNFCEENLEKHVWAGSDEVLERFRSVLDCLNILDLQFEFLGFSNSQIRNHSCWMTMRTSDSWAEQIREELGDFNSCMNIAKYSARLGLCFSETSETLYIEDNKINYISDIKRNGYVFSDGIGKISPEYFLQTREILKIHPNEELSAVQIRFGGFKGVLVLAPELYDCIAIRPSMYKFESNDRELEVCTFGKYKPAFLNRQIILLLYGLGVSENVFLRMQEEVINREYNREKKSFLAKNESFGAKFYKKERENKESNLKSQKFFDFTKEIRTRARIPVANSALLMGVLDEYSILLPNQTYIRISTKGKSTVITGDVVIAKNPCLHPGDIRVLEAVDIPGLAHLVNVVVFSQQGERPLPNMCSGSDLDGDEYFVSWNKSLIPEQISEPMVYDKDKELSEEITADKVKDYFIGYMKSEVLGRIANLHLAYADLNGVFSDEAVSLAKLHSRAVDYPKTGILVEIPNNFRLKRWPDFMEKIGLPSYESPGILGILYRSLKTKYL